MAVRYSSYYLNLDNGYLGYHFLNKHSKSFLQSDICYALQKMDCLYRLLNEKSL